MRSAGALCRFLVPSTVIVTFFWATAVVLAQDCNLNGVDDAADIEGGASADCNANGTPDYCETVPLIFAADGEPLTFTGLPQRVISGDLDGDARVDLIVGNWQDTLGSEARLSIFLNRGSRDFAPELALETPGLSQMEAADLDADGDLDLVTVEAEALRLYPNDSDGFGGQIQEGALEVAASPGMRELAVGDVNADGRPDLVTLNGSDGLLTWYPNLAERPLGESFRGEPLTFELFNRVGARTGLFLAAGDFDGDGDLDAAISNSRARDVSIFENGERGTIFAMSHSLPAAGRMDALVSSDLNGDGRADLLGAANLGHLNAPDAGRVGVWLSIEEGGFEEASTLHLGRLESMTLSNVDGDAFLDLVVGRREGELRTVGVLRGAGDGRFREPLTFGADGDAFTAGDFDGDGAADMAIAATDRMTLLFQGERRGVLLGRTRFDAHGEVHFLDVGDFSGDGIPDVVTANSDASHTVFFGNGDGTLAVQTVDPLGPSIEGAVVADLDRDGVEDLVFRTVGGEPGNQLIVQLSKGGGEFQEAAFFPTVLDGSQHLGKADVDGDGDVDIIGVNFSGLVAVHFGDGRGALSEPLSLEVRGHPWTVASGDLDADGDVDLVTPNGSSADISLLFQKNPQNDPQEEPVSFAPAVSVPLEGSPRGVALGDFDRDGDLDVVTANEGTQDVAIFLNRGDGVIDPPAHRFPLERNPSYVALPDLNQDGLVDVVSSNAKNFRQSSPEDGISVLLGRGDGTFGELQQFRTDGEPRIVVSADMDSDGDPDLVVGHRVPKSVVVLLNETVAAGLSDDFLATVCTPLEFERLSLPDGRSVISPAGEVHSERRTSFLLPVRNDPTLLSTLFVNATRFPIQRDFLREVFPERFADLSELGFTDLVLRRATRDYFSGAIRRLRLADGSTVYGFDVETDAGGPQELLSLEEIRAVLGSLGASFLITPLVYAPTTPAACEAAAGWMADFPVIPLCSDETPPQPQANPTFLLEIPEETVFCGVFALAGPERGPRQEYELKSRVRLHGGTLTLPTANETFGGELIEEVLFGPEMVAAEALDAGTFRVVRIAGPPNEEGPVTTYRFTYSQPFTLPADIPAGDTPKGGRLLELEVVSPLLFQARGEEPLAESQVLPAEYFVVLKGREPLQARLDGEPLLRYGSCSYESLPLWHIEADLADSTRLRLEERFEEAESLFDTAPASVVRAEVTLGGVSPEDGQRVVTDYVDLVYSASRHNRQVDYWVLLDPPVIVPDVGAVHGVELQAPEVMEDPPRDAAAAYLGPNFEVLRAVGVTRFSREQREVLFRRGDADGDGTLDVLDALRLLDHIFARGERLSCSKAGDANDDGRLNVVDAIAVVSLLFGGREALPAPFPACGSDPTADALNCRSAAPCP